MYTEFIIIYILLGILLLLGIATFIFAFLAFKKSNSSFSGKPIISTQSTNNFEQVNTQSGTTVVPASGNIVFCKKCAAEFDASARCCPKCGTPR